MQQNVIFGVLLGVGIVALGLRGATDLQAAERKVAREGNICLRGSLTNARLQFERAKKGHVAFIGGSITEMEGYRPMVCGILKRRFPNTEFVFTAAGIAFNLLDHRRIPPPKRRAQQRAGGSVLH